MTRSFKMCLLPLCLLFGLARAAHSQDPLPRRPRVGVALAGGGARGFAHIGFLKWLERNRIPVDYISGTSMGALVGSAYATGKSPKKIEALFDGMDWNAVLSGEAPFPQLSFRRKEDERRFPSAIDFGFRKNTLRFPRGLISNHAVGLILDRFALPYWQARSFDELPIPFRCVATDLVKGEAVTFRDGSLSEALRATMAIPGVFTPVRRPGQLLVDGGLLNNLPTEALLEMGAEVIIAVRLSRLPRNADELPIGGIVDGAIDVVLENNERRSVEAARAKVRVILLTLDVGAFTSADFEHAREIAARGEIVSGEAARELLQLAQETSGGWDAWRAGVDSRAKTEIPKVGGIQVAASSARAQREIEAEAQKGGGQPFDPPALERTLTRIYGNGRFDSVGYHLTGEAPAPLLQVAAEEKFHGPPFVRMLAEVNGSETDNIQFNFLARLTAMDVGHYGAEWRTDVSIGSRTAVASEYDRPLGNTRFFVTPRLLTERATQSLFQGKDRVAEFQVDRALAGFDLGYRFGRNNELRAGVEAGHIGSRVSVGDPLLPSVHGAVSRAFLRWNHDGQDSPMVPRRGWLLRAEGSWFAESPGASGRFPQAEMRSSAFFPVGARGSIFTILSGGTTFNDDAPPAQAFTLGGPFRLGALGLDEVRGNHFGYTALGYIREIFRTSPPFGTRVHIGAWYEVGKVFESVPPRGYYSNGSLGIVMETPLGPLFLGGSIGEEGRRKLYFKLGRFF